LQTIKTLPMIFLLLLGINLTLALIPEMSSENLFCGTPLKDSRIINGKPAVQNEYPWMVALHYGDSPNTDFYHGVEKHFIVCGGTLISSKTVLTAAHCIDRKQLYVGITNGSVSNELYERIPTEKITIHPKYGQLDRGLAYDVAILTLSRPVEFTKTLLPICMPDPNKDYSNADATLTGWGRTIGHEESPSQTLLTTSMPTMSLEECQLEINKHVGYDVSQVHASVICTKTPGTSGCHGDSGGPLITLEQEGAFYSQIGVFSYADKDCTMWTNFNAFASVMDQLYWISLETTGETLPAPVTRPTSFFSGKV